jgi:hypothetical protein
MKLVEDPVPTVNRMKCGCAITQYADGRKLFAPCIPCGLFQAGAALIEAGGWWKRRKALQRAGQALAAVATTINKAAEEAGHVARAVEGIAEEADDE